MNCGRARFLLSLRVDGEALPRHETEALERHIASCRDCRELHADEIFRADLLDGALRASPDTSLETELLAKALAPRPRPAPVGRFAPALVIVGLAAAAALAVRLGWGPFGTLEPMQSDGPLEIAESPVLFLEDSTIEGEVLTPEAGDPVQRNTRRSHWTVIPGDPRAAASPQTAGRLMLDVRRVDTNYVRMVDWR